MNRITTILATCMLAAPVLTTPAIAVDDPTTQDRLLEQRGRNVALRAELEQARERAAHARARAAVEMSRRVRIGVTLGQVHEALATHLGLDANAVLLIDTVIPGAAADTAGVKAYDIITHVDGTSPVTQQSLRETIMAKEPGETVLLAVLRSGEKHEIEVPVETASPTADVHPRADVFYKLSGDPDVLNHRLNIILKQQGIDEETKVQLQQQIGELLESRAGAMFQFEGPWQVFQQQMRDHGREVEIMRDGDKDVQMWMSPRRSPGAQQGLVYQFREGQAIHEERMQRIEQRLERIEQMLENLLEQTRN